MEFHEVRFPEALSFGSVGGPERRTEIVSLAGGGEERNTPWAHSRRRFDAGVGLRSLADIEALVGFFEARRGQLHGFRWKDWSDFRSCRPGATVEPIDQEIAIGDGATTTFSLIKTYKSGPSCYARPIAKPVAGSIRVAVSGVEPEFGDWSADAATGTVTFARPPGAGLSVTAGYEFDVPVRFDVDRIATSVAAFEAGEVPSVPVVEVRP